MHFLGYWNVKSTKTVELVLLVLMIAGLCTQNPVLAHPVFRKNNSINTFSQKFTGSTTSTNAFISTWNTSLISSGSSNSTQIVLPLVSIGTYSFTVDWGDNSVNSTITSYTQGIAPHNYTSAGVYTLIITGVISGWEFNDKGDVQKIIRISQWGPLNLGNTGNYFFGAKNLDITAIDPLNLTGTIDLDLAFTSCSSLGTSGTGTFNNWNVSQVTSMANMFSGDSVFNQPIGNWNVSQVTSMNSMFAGAKVFNQSIGNWNVSSVTDMSWMFYNAPSFNQPIGNWSVGKVTTMYNMFNQASAFNQNISLWDVSHVQSMNQMFFYDSAFNHPIDNWNVSQVTDMSYMFSQTQFNQSIGKWDVSNVTTMYNMFSWDLAFNQPIGNWSVGNVTSMASMFSVANSFNQSIGDWNVSSVTDMSYMFYSDLAFNQNISSWDVGKVTNMAWMFTFSPFNYNLSNWDVSNVQSMNTMFYGDRVFNQSIGNWNVTAVTDMTNMFYGDYAFNQPLGNWNVSSVTTMSGMFTGDTLSVRNYDDLLIGWSNLTLQIGVQFDVGNSQYSLSAASARQSIISNFTWYISDGGELVLTGPQYLTGITGNGSVLLSWHTPSTDGGSAISNYTIYRSTTSGSGFTFIATVSNSTFFYNDTGLINGQNYYYIVSVTNIAGTSTNCTQVLATPYTIPSAPQSLTAKAGNSSVLISWSAPNSNGGSAIIGYNIYVITYGVSKLTLVGSVSASTLYYNESGLNGSQIYYFIVTAFNNGGQSPDSSTVSATPYSAPTPPLSLQEQSGDSYVRLSWSTPNSNGGLPITGYNIYVSTDGGTSFTLLKSVNSLTLSYNDTGLTNGQTYYFKVTANNTAGLSPYSSVVNATPTGSVSNTSSSSTSTTSNQQSIESTTTTTTSGITSTTNGFLFLFPIISMMFIYFKRYKKN